MLEIIFQIGDFVFLCKVTSVTVCVFLDNDSEPQVKLFVFFYRKYFKMAGTFCFIFDFRMYY